MGLGGALVCTDDAALPATGGRGWKKPTVGGRATVPSESAGTVKVRRLGLAAPSFPSLTVMVYETMTPSW